MYGSTNEMQVMRPSTWSLVIPASASASLAALTYNWVALKFGTTPTSVSAAPTIATLFFRVSAPIAVSIHREAEDPRNVVMHHLAGIRFGNIGEVLCDLF